MRYLLLSLFFALLTPSFAEDYKVVKLRWEAIDGAKSYVIQVSDTSTFENILLEEKTKDTRIEFDYDPSYKFARFAGVDKNGIRGEFSEPVAVETRLATASRGGNHVYVSVGYVNWTSSAIENFTKFPNYSLLNKVLFYNFLQIHATNYTFNGSLSNQMKGRSIELGVNLSSKSGAWGHKISLRNVSAHPNNGFTLEQSTGTTVYESHSFDPLQMYLLRYNLQFFPWIGSSNKTLKQLAFQGGLNLQRESFDSSMLYFFLNPSSLFSLAGLLPQKNQYKSQTDFLNLGMAYNYEINKLHEIQIGLNYLAGTWNGENKYTYWIAGVIALPDTEKTRFKGKVSGFQWNLGYTYNLNPKSGIRLNFESRTLHYVIDEAKTTYRIALNLPLNHLGPLSTLRDKMDFISLEYFYKF